MNILSVSGFFQSLDPTELLPELDKFLSTCKTLVIICLMVGPIIMLLTGIKYWLAPANLPNHKSGFRTYFGMGSKAAWDYSQKLSGLVWTCLGGLLLIVMLIAFLVNRNNDQISFSHTSMILLFVQAGAALLAWLVMVVMITITFDRKGQLRRKRR